MKKSFIHKEVNNMYELVPFPQYDHKERLHRLPDEILRYKYMQISERLKGARMLDVGCGTGDRSILVAKHYGVSELIGIDACRNSLKIASQVALEEKFDSFKPIHGNLFDLPFENESFDVVVSWGVLHHTEKPFEGLKEMHRVCKKGGFIGFFVYNSYADWRHNLQRQDVLKNGGTSIDQKITYAINKYSKVPKSELDQIQISRLYDQYVHPYKSDHTLSEIFSWQKDLSIEYSGSFPPLEFRKLINYIKDRSYMNKKYPVRSFWGKLIINISSLFPRFRLLKAKNTRLNRFIWQIFFIFQGAGGQYSNGIALGGIKK